MYVVDVVAEGRLGSWPGRRTGRSAEDIFGGTEFEGQGLFKLLFLSMASIELLVEV